MLYRVVQGHKLGDRNCSLEFGQFLALFLETRWQRLGQFHNNSQKILHCNFCIKTYHMVLKEH